MCTRLITFVSSSPSECEDGLFFIKESIVGELSQDLSGHSVAINADNDYDIRATLAIGARANDGNGHTSGHCRVFRKRLGLGYVQIGQDLDGENAYDGFGHAVALSASGDIVGVSGPYNDATIGEDSISNSGIVKFFQYNPYSNTWEQYGNSLTGGAPNEEFGYSIALSASGQRAVIGVPGFNQNTGQIKVYDYNNVTFAWQQVGNETNGTAISDFSGTSVSISREGDIIAVGAPNRNNENSPDNGSVTVYKVQHVIDVNGTVTNTTWAMMGNVIYGEREKDRAGTSISLSSNGHMIAIGSPYNKGENGKESGSTRVFDYDERRDTWNQVGQDIDGERFLDLAGTSVSLSGIVAF